MSVCTRIQSRIASIPAAAGLLALSLAATANAACPAPGTTYSNFTCSNASSNQAPCYKTVISGIQHLNDQYGRYVMTLYRRKLYANAYYQWSLIADVQASCQR